MCAWASVRLSECARRDEMASKGELGNQRGVAVISIARARGGGGGGSGRRRSSSSVVVVVVVGEDVDVVGMTVGDMGIVNSEHENERPDVEMIEMQQTMMMCDCGRPKGASRYCRRSEASILKGRAGQTGGRKTGHEAKLAIDL